MDYQALGVGLAAVITALGALASGIYTGRNSRSKDENIARISLQNAEDQRQIALDVATKGQIESLARDATESRKRAREMEDEFDKRNTDLRRHGQRGWDLASYHFGLVAFMSHLLNDIFMAADTDGLLVAVKNAQKRIETVNIPSTLEDPIGDDGIVRRSKLPT